jgi:Leucine-rich repeat (LRR) protein
LFLSTAVVAAVPGFKQKVYADEGIAINETNFPDAEFRDYIKNGIGSGTSIDLDGDDVLSPEEISNATKIDVQQMGVHDLKGIEFFTSLESLNCNSNSLTNLDVSQNTVLSILSCANNQLTSLDVSNNLDLTNINCSSNQLTNLDVSQNTALKHFRCYDNQLTNLDVSQN